MPYPHLDLTWLQKGEDVAGSTTGDNSGISNRLGRELLANQLATYGGEKTQSELAAFTLTDSSTHPEGKVYHDKTNGTRVQVEGAGASARLRWLDLNFADAATRDAFSTELTGKVVTGQTCFVVDEGKVYQWDGAAWNEKKDSALEALEPIVTGHTTSIDQKANKDGTNLDAKSVALAALADDVLAAIGGGFDPANFLGNVTATTFNFPDPTVNTSKWYRSTVSGTPTGTNAPGTDLTQNGSVVSDGANWLAVDAVATALALNAVENPNIKANEVYGDRIVDLVQANVSPGHKLMATQLGSNDIFFTDADGNVLLQIDGSNGETKLLTREPSGSLDTLTNWMQRIVDAEVDVATALAASSTANLIKQAVAARYGIADDLNDEIYDWLYRAHAVGGSATSDEIYLVNKLLTDLGTAKAKAKYIHIPLSSWGASITPIIRAAGVGYERVTVTLAGPRNIFPKLGWAPDQRAHRIDTGLGYGDGSLFSGNVAFGGVLMDEVYDYNVIAGGLGIFYIRNEDDYINPGGLGGTFLSPFQAGSFLFDLESGTATLKSVINARLLRTDTGNNSTRTATRSVYLMSRRDDDAGTPNYGVDRGGLSCFFVFSHLSDAEQIAVSKAFLEFSGIYRLGMSESLTAEEYAGEILRFSQQVGIH